MSETLCARQDQMQKKTKLASLSLILQLRVTTLISLQGAYRIYHSGLGNSRISQNEMEKGTIKFKIPYPSQMWLPIDQYKLRI